MPPWHGFAGCTFSSLLADNRSMFRRVGKGVKVMGLGNFDDTRSPVILAALGGLCVSVIGVLVPPTMFWSEFEIASIAEPGKPLPHIWPPVSLAAHERCANLQSPFFF